MAERTLKAFPSLQNADFKKEAPSDQLRTEPSDELARCPGRTAGCQDIVNYQDAIARLKRVTVSLQRVRAVLQFV